MNKTSLTHEREVKIKSVAQSGDKRGGREGQRKEEEGEGKWEERR